MRGFGPFAGRGGATAAPGLAARGATCPEPGPRRGAGSALRGPLCPRALGHPAAAPSPPSRGFAGPPRRARPPGLPAGRPFALGPAPALKRGVALCQPCPENRGLPAKRRLSDFNIRGSKRGHLALWRHLAHHLPLIVIPSPSCWYFSEFPRGPAPGEAPPPPRLRLAVSGPCITSPPPMSASSTLSCLLTRKCLFGVDPADPASVSFRWQLSVQGLVPTRPALLQPR